MNWPLIVATLRSQSSSWIRLILLAMVALAAPIIELSMGNYEPAADNIIWIVWILGAGIIGRDLSSGVMQMVLVRPITRPQYVISKYLALAGGVCAIILLNWAMFLVFGKHTIAPAKLAYQFADSIAVAFGASSVVILFSSLLPGLGDLGIYFLLYLVSQLMMLLGHHYQLAFLIRATREIQNFIMPFLAVEKIAQGPLPWFDILSFFSTLTFCLAVAIILVNRRELSYAT